MNDPSDLTPPVPPDAPGQGPTAEGPIPPTESGGGALPPGPPPTSAISPSWWSRYRRYLIPAGAVIVLATVAAATLLLVLKPASTVEKMVPASENVLVIANIDPSATQKANLLRALHAFPDLSTDKAISNELDKAFKDSGLSFSGDIQPWLGAEIGLSGQISMAKSAETPVAFYFVSRDDAKAKAALARLRTGKVGSQLNWQDQSYDGITISVGTPKGTSAKPVAYAYVDHVVILASSASEIRGIIDADQGRTARLVDSANYKATLAALPADRLAVLYVDGKSLVSGIKQQLATMSHLSTGSSANLADLDAFQGIGATISANGDGLLADLVIKLDQSKLSPATRQAMANAGHPDKVLTFIPRGSDAFFAFGNLKQTVKSLLAQIGPDPSVSTAEDAVGLTAVLPHLRGGAGLELEVGTRVIPAGAILLGTDDAASMRAFLRGVVTMATEINAQSTLLGPSQQMPAATFKTVTYRGVAITAYDGSALGAVASAFQPSYAVTDGMGILASNVAEVKAVIDAHLGAGTVAADPTYQAALQGTLKQPSGIIYVNVGSLVDALRRFSAQSGLSTVDTKTLASLAPVKALILTATSTADAAFERLFVVIQ